MKRLRDFEKFDINSFLKGKVLLFVSEKEYQKYEDGRPVGREGLRADLIIVKDDTHYETGQTQDNLYEKISVKVPTSDNSFGIEVNTPVSIKGVRKATVYGQYRNNLSIEAEDILPVMKKNDSRD